MKLQTACPVCQKNLQLVEEIQLGPSGYWRTYRCGHTFFEDSPAPTEQPSNFTSRNFKASIGPKEAFNFQKAGVEFIEKTHWNCLLADPMGLGKTIQALLAAREAKRADGQQRFKSVLVLVKSATTYQWYAESKEWYSPALWSTFIIQGTKPFIPPGFSVYILSMDTLSRFQKAKNGGLQRLKDLDIDLVIVDECHSFKNPESARAQALVAFLQDISQTEIERPLKLICPLCQHEWQEITKIRINLRSRTETINHRHQTSCPQCKASFAQVCQRVILDERERNKGLIMLSGTPIKNRAEEYFVPLNLLRPDVFTSLESFKRQWLDKDEVTGRWNRIKPWRLEAFRSLTSNFILRREKNEVLSLPPFRRAFQKISLEDPKFIEAYNRAVGDLQECVDNLEREGKEITFTAVDTCLMTLRRIIGQAKVEAGIEYIEEFLESVEDEKIAVGIHHQTVRNSLYFHLNNNGIKALKLSGEDSAETKNRTLRHFSENPDCRVLIVNMIAGGQGLNIQAANNVLTLERQWNAADEEQFEGRFWRQGQTLPVLNEYLVAAGLPIEDYFNALVESKRQICGESLDGWDFRSDKDAVRDLVYKTLASKLKVAA